MCPHETAVSAAVVFSHSAANHFTNSRTITTTDWIAEHAAEHAAEYAAKLATSCDTKHAAEHAPNTSAELAAIGGAEYAANTSAAFAPNDTATRGTVLAPIAPADSTTIVAAQCGAVKPTNAAATVDPE